MDQTKSLNQQISIKEHEQAMEKLESFLGDYKAGLKNQEEAQIVTRKITQKFTMDKLMMMLDKKKLEALEEEFQQHPDGIRLANFVWLMKAAVNHSEKDRYDLVYGLQKLFSEIDINGDEHMEWAEFTQYIIDAVIQNQSGQIGGPSLGGTKNKDILLETKIMKFKKYNPSKMKDKTSHLSHIQSAVWCQKFQALMVLEHHQKSIKMVTQDLQHKFIIELPQSSKEIYVVDIDYSNEHHTFGCVDSDSNILFWEYYISLKLTRNIKASCVQTKIKYLKHHKTWLTVGADNNIREYDITKPLDQQPLILIIEGHKKAVLEIIELQNPFAIATGSMDTTIRIYSLVDKEEIAVLTEHRKGVRSITYNPNFGGFIVSAGFERDLYVWSPELATRKSLIGKLEGHTEIVAVVRFLNNKPYCVSIDEKFNIRFWDVRNFVGVQVIANEQNAQIPCYGLLVLPNQDRFMVFSKRFLYFDTSKKDGINSKQEDVIPILAEFSYYYLHFFVVTQSDLRIYDAKDGRLLKIIQNIQDQKTNAPITAFCTDDRQRKFYVGDQQGAIRQYNISNGVLIKTIQKNFQKKHDQTNAQLKNMYQLLNQMDSHEISTLKFINLESHETQLLVTTSWDSSLQVYDEQVPEESKLLRHSVGGHIKEDICCMEVNTDLSLIATGSCSGVIAIWDFETNKLEGFCVEHTKAISSLQFMHPLPVLISSCNEGFVCFWAIKYCPFEFRYKLMKKIRNNLLEAEMCFWKMNITSAKMKIIFNEQTHYKERILMIGDESGYIHKWNINKVEQELRSKGFKDIQSISTTKPSFNPKKNAFVNAQTSATNQLLFAEEQNQKKIFQTVNSEGYVKIDQWFAHQGQISNIQYLQKPDGIVTCSADKHVMLWSINGELWGDIFLLKEKYDKQWVYPFDWSEKKEQELHQVKTLMSLVEGPNMQKKNVIEEVVFEQGTKKQKDKREIIDYLAKRRRRQEIEEQQRRQLERAIKLQNEELLKAHYVSEKATNVEQIQREDLKEEQKRIEQELYNKKIFRKGLAHSIDRNLESKITESELRIRFNLRPSSNINIIDEFDQSISGAQGGIPLHGFTSEKSNMHLGRTTGNLNFHHEGTMMSSVSGHSPPKTTSNARRSPNINTVQQQSHNALSMDRKSLSQQSMKIKSNLPAQAHSSRKTSRKDRNKEFNQRLLQKMNNTSGVQDVSGDQKSNKSPFGDPLANIQHSSQQKGYQNTLNSTKFSFYDPTKNQNQLGLNPKLYDFKEPIITPKNMRSALSHMKHDISSPILLSNKNQQSNNLSSQKKSKKIGFNETHSTFQGMKHGSYFNHPNRIFVQSPKSPTDKIDQLHKTTTKKFQTLAYSLHNLDDQLDFNRIPDSQMSKKNKDLINIQKERRVLIGMEGAKSSNFIKKLNNFIGSVGKPSSRISDRVKDVKFTNGEGMRVLKLSYAQSQYENKILQTDEFGFKKKEPRPKQKNIFQDTDILAELEQQFSNNDL